MPRWASWRKNMTNLLQISHGKSYEYKAVEDCSMMGFNTFATLEILCSPTLLFAHWPISMWTQIRCIAQPLHTRRFGYWSSSIDQISVRVIEKMNLAFLLSLHREEESASLVRKHMLSVPLPSRMVSSSSSSSSSGQSVTCWGQISELLSRVVW